MGATEKYLLGELRGRDREEFEEHFFECSECAADVKGGAIFVSAAKKQLATTQAAPARVSSAPPQRAGWLEAWFRPQILVPVLAALVLIVVYQNVVSIPQLRNTSGSMAAPQTLQSFSLVATRGGEPRKIQVPASSPFSLYVDVPPGGSYSAYSLQVVDAAGKSQFSLQISAAQAKDTVQILVPGSKLSAGNYTLEVRGEDASGAAANLVANFPFSLEFVQ